MESTGHARGRSSAQAVPLSFSGRAFLALLLPLACLECASPGPPRPPSLHLPEPVRDLSAARVGESVELRFTVPRETTDGDLVRSGTLAGTVCRAEGNGPCLPFAGGPNLQGYPVADSGGGPNLVTFHDDLPPALRTGPPRLLAYRVEFFNPAHRSAGFSEPAYTAAGSAPAPVLGLRAVGSRQGVLVEWQPGPAREASEVLLRRDRIGAPPSSDTARPRERKSGASPEPAGTVWLEAHNQPPGGGQRYRTLDDSATAGEVYRYAAQRRLALYFEGHATEIRSELSAPVTLRLLDTYPPPTPAGLTAAGFSSAGHYAVDLIWEPVIDRTATGYLVTRSKSNASGARMEAPVSLNTEPVATPAFHDTTPVATERYRYEVVAVDAKGNRSAPVTTVVEPQSAP